MKEYTTADEEITMEYKGCISCRHCYIPQDFLTGVGVALLFCNQAKDRPRSGDILNEPFDYYDQDSYKKQLDDWRKWADEHAVDINGTCSLYEVPK